MTAPPPTLVPARPLGAVVPPVPVPASVGTTAARAARTQAARLRRPVAIAARLFGLAAAAVATGGLAAGVGVVVGAGSEGIGGPLAAIVVAALYAVPLWLLWTCRAALLAFPRFLDRVAWVPAPASRGGEPRPGRRPRTPIRVLRASGRIARGATGSVRAAAEVTGLWRLASPFVSIGGAVAFVTAPALLLLGLMCLVAGVVLA